MAKKGRERVDKRNPEHRNYEQRVAKPAPPKYIAGDTNDFLAQEREIENLRKKLMSIQAEASNIQRVAARKGGKQPYSGSIRGSHPALLITDEVSDRRQNGWIAAYRMQELKVGHSWMPTEPVDGSDTVAGYVPCEFCGQEFMVIFTTDTVMKMRKFPINKRYCSKACKADHATATADGERYVRESLGVTE